MDFWSRLLASAGVPAGKSRKDAAKDPAKRLHRFEKEYGQLLHLWRVSGNLSIDEDAIEDVELRLQQLTETLSDETRRPLPHPCIQFAALKKIYVPIAKIASSSGHEWIVNETVLFFATLIESEEENFVENLDFSNSLTALLTRITKERNNGSRLSPETEERVVELAFNITTKLRLSPEILPAWFRGGMCEDQQQSTSQQLLQVNAQITPSPTGHTRNISSTSHTSTRQGVNAETSSGSGGSLGRFTGRTQKQDFPLFYILMDYIHHEGKIGDFARTGLLYIIEASANATTLEQWIVESDLSTLMATGLGAQYSQLSRKLVVDYVPDNLPPVLAFSDYQHPPRTYEIESSCSAQFQAHLDAFLSHLLFWQDVLNHCKSNEIKSTLLEHFQVIFLQQLLYPSLLESSDIDGGSSVAVLTYLRRILESLDHPDMINLILHYLLDLPGPSSPGDALEADKHGERYDGEIENDSNDIEDGEDNMISAARKRKSMDLATMLARTKPDISSGPLLFNLVDLILACLRSHSQQTILVTLQLISTIIKRHHRYGVITLLRTESTPGESSRRTMGAHSQEVEYLMSLASVIGGEDNFEQIYESVVKDTTTKVEGHLCSLKLVSPNATTSNHGLPTIADSLPGAPREVRSHTLRPDDPLLNAALDHLETFLLNPVDMNLSLTETLTDLATCGFMNLEGWLLRHPHKYMFDENLETPLGANTGEDYEDEDSTAESLASCLPPEPDSPSFAEYQRKQQLIACRRRPRWESLPRMLVILDHLCKQVSAYRESIPRFNELLQQRREAFQMADSGMAFPPRRMREPPTPNYEMLQAPSLFTRSASQSRAASPVRGLESLANTSPVRGLENFANKIFAELGVPELGSPPRRQSTPQAQPVVQSQPQSQMRLPIRDRKEALSPSLFPIDTRTANLSPSGPSAGGSAMGESRHDSPVASQVAVFAAMDQSILARKVGAQGGLRESMRPTGLTSKSDAKEERSNLGDGPVGSKELDGEEGLKEQQRDTRAEEPLAGDKETDPGAGAPAGSQDGSGASQTISSQSSVRDSEPAPEIEVTVSHILTNVVILQAFLFELSALVQVRAGLFNEVRFV
ncbi:hypothetical protein HOO65_021159 [Ceratocystis lukuohia]|uniref:Uncharacterized protein n=1 Tax=Ceratocystis lukuohia TaxID=2019550 RepID=A0ABR4MQP7_9PEZI